MTTRRDKGSGGLHKRASDGMWIASISLPPGLDGKRRRRTVVRKSKAEAVKALREMRAEVDAHGDMETRRTRVSGWMQTYLEKIALRRDRPGPLSTKIGNNKNWITPVLGKRYLDRLTPDDVRTLHDAIRDAGLSESSVSSVHSTLSAALRAAMVEGKVRVNVCTLVDTPKAKRATDNALSLEDARRLVEHLSGRPDAPLWMTFLLTGARRGEVLGLEIERVHPYTLDFRWQLQAPKIGATYPPKVDVRPLTPPFFLVDPKTSTSRRVVPKIPLLGALLDRQIGDRTEGLVFTDESGKPYRPDRITKEWKRLLAEAGLPSTVTLHGARHTVVDLLYSLGVEERIITQMLGHSSKTMTRSYQQNIDMTRATEALTGMGEKLVIASVAPDTT